MLLKGLPHMAGIIESALRSDCFISQQGVLQEYHSLADSQSLEIFGWPYSKHSLKTPKECPRTHTGGFSIIRYPDLTFMATGFHHSNNLVQTPIFIRVYFLQAIAGE